MENRMIKRHTKRAIFLHWFNTACWLFLLATGVGLIDNDELQPLGMWWVDCMHRVFGNGEILLIVHQICGLVWGAVLFVFAIVFVKSDTIPFIKEAFVFSARRDFAWLAKKGITMTLGDRTLKKLGFDSQVPHQGFYNAGQRLFAVLTVIGGVVIAVTGIIMTVSKLVLTGTSIVQWSILIHFVFVGFVCVGALFHLYMAVFAEGERPAFFSMFTGTVPEDYARHRHALWYEGLEAEEDRSRKP